MRFFPNQAADLEPVLALLARLDAEVRCQGFRDSAGFKDKVLWPKWPQVRVLKEGTRLEPEFGPPCKLG